MNNIDKTFWGFMIPFIVFLIAVIVMLTIFAERESDFLETQTSICRSQGGYIEKDYEGQAGVLKGVFCWDRDGKILLFRKSHLR